LTVHRQWALGAALGLGLVGVLSASGCELIAGLDGEYKLDTAPPAPVCDPMRPPDAPTTSGASGDISFTVAIRKVNLGETDAMPRIGFDLDNACSCTIDDHTCAKPPWVDKSKRVCDNPRGVDNGTSVALQQANVIAAGAVSSAVISEGAQTGVWSLLLRVKGYSGMPDDDQVEVAAFVTTGLVEAMITPAWDGNDVWPIAETSVEAMNLDQPKIVDPAAYVRNGELVAHLPSLELFLRATMMQLPMKVNSVVVSAKIEPSGASYALREGTMAGKWLLPDMFTSLAGLRYGVDNQICKSSPAYTVVRSIFCNSTDIYSGDVAPSPGDAAAMPQCDSVSFGMNFEADPAQLGAIVPPAPPPPDGCADGQSPVGDMCN
jgi:hypothetical protein